MYCIKSIHVDKFDTWRLNNGRVLSARRFFDSIYCTRSSMHSCTNTALRRERATLMHTAFADCTRLCTEDGHCKRMHYDSRTSTCELEGEPRAIGWITCRRRSQSSSVHMLLCALLVLVWLMHRYILARRRSQRQR